MTASTDTLRRRARELAFRVAYQADLMGEPFATAWSRTREQEHLTEDQQSLIGDVVTLLDTQGEVVDAALRAAAQHWELSRLAATDRSVMRIAVAELMSRPGTPARVVLDEAIEIAKRYGSVESGRFVNGVLDKAARALRPGEL